MSEIRFGSFSSAIGGLNKLPANKPAGELSKDVGTAESSASFMETLKGFVSEANQAQKTADKAAQDFASGQGGDLHDVMIAIENADLALRTVTTVRNKAVEAYQEIMRMPV